MFRKILPVLAVCLLAVSGTADDMTVDNGCSKSECPQPCSTPAAKPDCPAPCPKPAPTPCPKPCPAPACAPKPCPPKPCPPKPCCNPPPPCCWNFNPCNPKGCTDMNCGGFYVSADFLYWRSENHGFSYAYELKSTTQNVGSVVRIDPEWDPAFRVGAGWNTTYDFWDVFLDYTWYQNRSSESSSSAIGFIPLWPVSSSTTGQYRDVSASSRFSLNMGDLEIGRMVYLTKSIAVRPHWGARGGTLHQKFKDNFSGLLSGASSAETFNGRNNYWGVGPRTGVNGEWHMSRSFSILGKAAGALLYGKTQVKNEHQTLASGGTVFVLERQYKDNFYQLVPNLQLALGLQWQTCFWCEKMFFKMSASWETNYWWNQFNIPYSTAALTAPMPTVGNQPLTMEGLTLNFELDF